MQRFRNTCACAAPEVGSVYARWSDFCAVAPSPELKARLKAELAQARGTVSSELASALTLARSPTRLGFNDGVIFPPDQFPEGTPKSAIRNAAADRAPLRGPLRVIVVLAQFSDKAMMQTAQHYRDLFFSSGVLPHGSVKEYYQEVTGGLVDIVGEVVGPYTLPQTLAWYANNNFGISRGGGAFRANILAKDAAVAANPAVNFGLYDNDGNGFVDAFIVVHAGRGGEQTGHAGDIWSHKHVLPAAMPADGKQIYAYLTVPEDAKLGVCAHELGHLLFGFPDLYDTDGTSEGIGDWCLMSGGSWNGGGDIPAHPSAWCKVNQGWVGTTNVTTSGTVSLPDVKTSHTVHRMWKNGAGSSEYFLLENRQRSGFDAQLPGAGLLVWHIDESQPGNSDESHYKVALVQADGLREIDASHPAGNFGDQGDSGDPFPGAAAKTAFNATTTPNSKSYAGVNTCVSVTAISASGPTMAATLGVRCSVKSLVKDRKDVRKEGKELTKEAAKEGKEVQKEIRKETAKEVAKEIVKDRKDMLEHRIVRAAPVADPGHLDVVLSDLEARLQMLEATVGARAFAGFAGFGGPVEGGEGRGMAQPFIDASLRPDLEGGPVYDASTELQQRMAGGDRDAKRAFDAPLPK
jgi:immune inhibitor A